jgi:hypothetical protein
VATGPRKSKTNVHSNLRFAKGELRIGNWDSAKGRRVATQLSHRPGQARRKHLRSRRCIRLERQSLGNASKTRSWPKVGSAITILSSTSTSTVALSTSTTVLTNGRVQRAGAKDVPLEKKWLARSVATHGSPITSWVEEASQVSVLV